MMKFITPTLFATLFVGASAQPPTLPPAVADLTPVNGCYRITDEGTCTTSKDGRNYYLNQPCTWCCGLICHLGDNNVCEPHDWLMLRSDYVGTGTNGAGYNTCDALPEPTLPPTPNLSTVAPSSGPTVNPPSEPYECQDEDRKSNMGEFTIEKVGKASDDQSFPFGKVFFIDKAGEETVDGNPHRLVANIYFEFDEDKLQEKVLDGADEQGEGNPPLELIGGFQQVYINVPDDDEDCGARGIPLDKSDWHHSVIRVRDYNYAKFNTPIDESTCFPSTKQGRVTRVNVVIKDPLSVGSLIVKGDDRNIIDFCYRVGYTMGEGDEKILVNFEDTKVRGVVTVEGIFGNFDQAIEIVGPDATEIETSVETKVEVEVFLCNNKNMGTTNVQDRQYQIGQNFRLCVTSSNEKYEVTEFKDVSCGTRQLVSEGGAFDELSIIYLVDKDGNVVNDSIAVKSVITATIITEGTKDGSILCQGEVTLKKLDGTTVVSLRNLQEVSSGSEADDDELLETSFDLKLNLATPNVNLNKSIESSASLPSLITTTAVAVIGFGVALFL